MTMGASYVVGDRVAIAGNTIWLLADLPPADPMVGELWAAIRDGADVDALIDVLFSAGLRTAPAFALVQADAPQRVVARGDAEVRVLARTGERTIRASTRAPWVEEDLDGSLDAVTLLLDGGPDMAAEELPVSTGVTLARSVAVRFATEPSAAAPTPTEPAAGEPTPALEPAVIPERPVAPDSSLGPVPAATPPPLAPQDEPEPPAYDFLFGATQRPMPVQQFFSPPSGATPVPPAVQPEASSSSTKAWEELSIPPAPLPPASPEVIDSMPWAGGLAGPSSSPPRHQPSPPGSPGRPPSRGAEGLRVDVTLSRSDLASTLTVRCPHGHATAPSSARCRVCGTAVPLQEPFATTRPSLGVLRLPTGDAVPLDHGVLIGRSPSAAPGTIDTPHLVRVADPNNDISRDHAEIVLEAWHVSVRDLGSTNGTVVELPGAAPRRLRDGELQLLEHGAVVVLADEVRCVFEVTG